MTQKYNAQLVDELSPNFPRRKDVALDLGLMDSLYMNLLGVRSYWNFARITELFAVMDQVRGMTLTKVGAGTTQTDTRVTSHSFSGAGQYLWRASEVALNITGGETGIHANNRGMTIGCWIYPTSIAAGARNFVSKWDANNYQFYLRQTAAVLQFGVSRDGTSWVTVAHGTSLVINQWQFVVGRLDAGTALEVNLDGDWDQNLVGVPPTIFQGDAPLVVGAHRTIAGAVTELFAGQIANVFYAASDVPDWQIEMIRQWTRPLFGV